MSLGAKLQTVAQKINTKLGKQDKTIIFRTITRTGTGEFGTSAGSASNSDVTITAGIAVSRIKAWQTDSQGQLKLDDLKLEVPGNLVTEDQIKTAVVLYGSDPTPYTIISRAPAAILNGLVTRWLLVVRQNK